MWTKFVKAPLWVNILVSTILLLVSAYGAFRLWLYFHDKKVEQKYESKVQAKIEKKTAKARDRADVQRVRDVEYVTKIQKENYDAIEQAPDGAPSAAHVQLGCLRLRRAGATELPVACGSDGDLKASPDF